MSIGGLSKYDGVHDSQWSRPPVAWTSLRPPSVCLDFWTGAYQAIDD